MKVGLYNLEKKIKNTALMQVSQYHKDKGDDVELYNPLFHSSYDKIYAFSIFNFSDKGYVKENMICGGTGFNIQSRLPKNIEDCELDYSIYPKCDTSYLWFSRGCPNKCGFCVVPQKEGNIRVVKHKNLNPNGKYIDIMDNNFFASPGWKDAIKQLIIYDLKINFSSGIDVRIFKDEHGYYLQKLKFYKQVHIAWDNPKQDLTKNIKLLTKYVKSYKIMCYTLIGYDSTEEEDLYRVETLRDMKIDPFVMPFNKRNRYQKDFSRWVNRKEIFKSVKWEDYKKNPSRYDKEQTLIPIHETR